MIDVTPIPAFQDNYIWLLQETETRQAAVVDPGDAAPVLDTLNKEGLTLVAILITHHHMDHVGGVARLLQDYPGLPVFGPASERVSGLTRKLAEGDEITVPELNARFQVLDIPGHTAGHIAYYGEGLLFCGDTLFACGCGRLFEGSPEQMHHSLSKLAALSDDTLVYCGHEYTLSNIAFARRVEPDNPDLLQRERDDQALRNQNRPTVPSRLALERRTNPFLRSEVPDVIRAAEQFVGRPLAGGAEVFATVRRWKDNG